MKGMVSMKKVLKSLIVFSLLLVIFGCGKGEELNYIVDQDENGTTIYEIDSVRYIETEEKTNLVKINVPSYGIIIAELYPEIAPITVENFQKLVSEHFFDNMIFHRVIKDFMIQTGDPTGTGTGGSAVTIKGEFSENGVANDLLHTRGVLSMARQGAIVDTEETMNSASSQFFIVHQDSPHLNGKYAAFGKVIHGMDVVDSVAEEKTNQNDKPLIDQVINNIRFVKKVK
jgi:peptidyl-prolyl cis-trans isomerase B (cyclophilin B)